MLGHAVGIQELAGDIYDLIPPPVHDETGFLRNFCHNGGFQVFLIRKLREFFPVFFPDHNRHAFLGFGNRQFRSVQAGIFFGYFVQIDLQPFRQFADGYGNTAGAEIVAAFYQHRYFGIPEQALDLPFRRRIPFLHFRSAGRQGIYRMFLGGTGCPADAVTARTSAQQYDDISCRRTFPDHRALGSSPHDRADFHTFRHKTVVIIFLYLPGSQTDLVAVRGIPGRRPDGQLALGQFARQGFFDGRTGIAGAGNTHRLIHIGPA